MPSAVERFREALVGARRRRIELQRIRAIFAHVFPELAERPDRRDLLWEFIRTGAENRWLQLPRSTSAWDRTGSRPLPTFILVEQADAPKATTVGYAWHPLLTFAARERNTRRLATLRTINEWLKTQPDLSVIVPIKERSLEIFGDEKKLDQLRSPGASLFDGQLSLTQLGCKVSPLPPPYRLGEEGTRGLPILVVENHDSWESFANWNRKTHRFSAVVYGGGGGGKAIAYDETSLDELLERCGSTSLLYLGDVDPRGLRIAAGTAQRRTARGAVGLAPAVAFYEWLLRHGVRRPLRSREQVDSETLAWLPEELRRPIEELFAARQRIPQESLGTRVLETFNDPVARIG